MRIKGDKLGIGTASPAAPLVIQTTNTLGITSAPTGSVSIGSPSSTPQGAVLGRQTANAVALNIMAAGVDGNTNGDMIFNTRKMITLALQQLLIVLLNFNIIAPT